MTPVFLKPFSSAFSHDVGDQRDHQDHKEQNLKLFISPHNEGSSSSSSSLAVSPSPTFLNSNTCQDRSTGVFQMHEQHDKKDVAVDLVSTKYDDNGGSGKYWMSSKMRLIHKMANPETPAETDLAASGGHNNTTAHNHNYHNHYVNNSNNNDNKGVGLQSVDSNKQDKTQITFSFSHTKNNSAGLRFCSDCNTTSTPLWRSGPRGPKSLCNACGIRQRKARRAMAEAATGGGDSEATVDKKTKTSGYNYKKAHIIKEKNGRPSNIAHHRHYKSKLKLRIVDAAKTTQRLNGNKLCFTDLSFSLNDNHSVFPQDVAEAAVLLMELSCHGLVHS